ncbi:MAG: acetyltransferase [Bacilli bacterium]|nr:acetyltransferase [Bacilli bacterium]
MSRDIIIIGAGGHARVIADIISRGNDNLVGFLDDDLDKIGKCIYDDKKVIGRICDGVKYKNVFFIIGIGSNAVRMSIANKYDYNWCTLIDSSAIIGNNVKIGEGTVIMPGVVINTGSIIGSHCIINTCSSIDHDNTIEDFVHISPGSHLAGTVFVGSLTWICMGVNVINNISIGKNNIIGAGATVLKNIDSQGKIYIGTPAIDMELRNG